MKQSTCTKFSAAVFMAMFVCQQPGVAGNYMRSLGEQYFKSGQYQDAANILAIAASEDPRNAYVHYMRATALAKLRQNAEAVNEFKICLSLDHGTLAQYSRQALAGLDPLYQAKSKPSVPKITESDEAARERLTNECDTVVDRINKDIAAKIKALENERNAKLLAAPPAAIHDTEAANAAINKEYAERIEILRADESNKVAEASAYYARKLSTLKKP